MITKKIILASKSPRRQQLIGGLELNYDVYTYDTDESFPEHLKAEKIVLYLAQKKADAYPRILNNDEILVTADTIVWINDSVLNKPVHENEAYHMLRNICGSVHKVYTGVCLRSDSNTRCFFECTDVQVANLSDEAIWHYINNYKPFDKAGSYGIQDWFGYTAVERIDGCFYNVMGLPVSRLYKELQDFN